MTTLRKYYYQDPEKGYFESERPVAHYKGLRQVGVNEFIKSKIHRKK